MISDHNDPYMREQDIGYYPLALPTADERLCGLALLENRIYGINKLKEIYVYLNEKPFPLQDTFNLKEANNPMDLAACEKTKCLYVSDIYERCIWRILVSDRRVDKWVDTGSFQPWRISVAEDGRVLVTMRSSELILYGCGGETIDRNCVKNIAHDFDRKPSYAVEYSAGNVLIVYEEKDSGFLFNILMQSKHHRYVPRRVTARYVRPDRFSGNNWLYGPTTVTVDHQNGLIFALDRMRQSVMLLDPKLQVIR